MLTDYGRYRYPFTKTGKLKKGDQRIGVFNPKPKIKYERTDSAESTKR